MIAHPSRHRSSSLAVIALAALATLGACATRDSIVERDATCPPSSLPPVAHCADSAPGLRIGGFLDMPHNDLPAAALTAAALDGNHPLLMGLAGQALMPDVLTRDHAFVAQLLGAYAPELVSYVVSCALDPCDAVDIPPELASLHDAYGGAFRGELGLCGERAEQAGTQGDKRWRDGPATSSCLERVSACVLARTNAIGSKVVFSMRGEAFAQQPRVPVRREFREGDGTPIASFAGCDAACLSGDPLKRNCDWEPRFVGQCIAKDRVRLALSDGRTPARIRVCAGIYGCDSYAPGAGAATVPDSHLPRYGGVAIADSAAGALAFTCPSNGPVLADGTPTGYYAVMVGALNPEPLPAGVDVERVDLDGGHLPSTEADAYPASERAVFTYREGAFYGTLFDEAHVPPTANQLDRELSGDQYACYSSAWTVGAAASSHRWCAGAAAGGPTRSCFVNEPGPCDDGPDGHGRCQQAGHEAPIATDCEGLNAVRKDVTRWQRPYTTYLNHPCDLFADDQACVEAIDPVQFPWIVPRPIPPPPGL